MVVHIVDSTDDFKSTAGTAVALNVEGGDVQTGPQGTPQAQAQAQRTIPAISSTATVTTLASQAPLLRPVEQVDRRERSCLRRVGAALRARLLVLLSVLGIVLGFAIGFGVRPYKPGPDFLMWLGFPGDIFLNMLTMTVIPLIVSSVITATASMDPSENGKIGAVQVSFLAGHNLLGAALGVLLGATVKPGAHLSNGNSTASIASGLQTQDIFADLLRNLFPSNIVQTALQKKVTVYQPEPSSDGALEEMLKRTVTYTNSTNVLGLIFVCIMFGLAAGKAKEKGRPFLAFFKATSDIVLILIGWFLWFSPIGICSLIAVSLASIEEVATTLSQLGLFVATIVGGVVGHQLLVLPLIHLATVRTNPLVIIARSVKAWFMGFASASSAGSMPYFYEIADSYQVDRRVSSFCIPIGVTLCANGSALFICAAVLFLAQMNGIVLDVAQMCVMAILTTISSLALPSVPSSSLVVIVILCTTLSVPAASVGLLFATEWLLDRLRTTSNVMTEVYAVLFTWRYCQSSLRRSDLLAAHAGDDEDDEELGETPFDEEHGKLRSGMSALYLYS